LKYINKTNNDVLIDVAKKTLLENPKMLLKDFLKYTLINYDENADELQNAVHEYGFRNIKKCTRF
jgi:hypothetical protein